MWYYRPNKFFFIALIVILILSTTVKAELIYQPTESKKGHIEIVLKVLFHPFHCYSYAFHSC